MAIEREHRRGPDGWIARDPSGEPKQFLGYEVARMSPAVQMLTALAVLLPTLVVLVVILAAAPEYLWLIFFTFGWTIPALGLLARGAVGLMEDGSAAAPAAGAATGDKEGELLEALRGQGEASPAGVAADTSLTVAEADAMLSELAGAGHLRVLVRGGGIFYSLWEKEADERG